MSNAHIPLDRLEDNPHQSRLDVGDTEGLAVTILDHGLQSVPPGRLVDEDGALAKDDGMPITMAPTAELDKNPAWTVQLAAGHRRKEAVRLIMDVYEAEGVLGGQQVTRKRLKRAGLRPGKMPVEVKALTDADMLDVLTIENAQREELSPIEQARLIGELAAAGRSGEEIGERFGKSPSWVSNRKRLTRLPAYVQEHVHEGEISVRQAQALVRAEAVAEQAKEVFESYNALNSDLKPGTMVKLAADGEITSDGIRERTEALEDLIETKQNAETEQTDEDRGADASNADHDETDDSGAHASDANAAGAGDSGHESLDGRGERREEKPERSSGATGGEPSAVSEEVSGDGAPAEELTVTDIGGEPGVIGQLIAEIEKEAMGWELGSSGDTYFARIQDGDVLHAMTGAETPVQALRHAHKRAMGETCDVGHVSQDDVSALLSCSDPEDMWDEEAASGASIASLYVAYCVSEERMEQWRSDLLVEEMRGRTDGLTEEDFPDDVWEEVQAEIDRQLEPAAA